jgi:hydrogenase maturation protein HypF
MIRRRLEIGGRVQGVGFRPCVARIARELALAGFVGNDARGVFVELEGPTEALDRFVARLRRELPPLAQIHRLEAREIPPRGTGGFAIVQSEDGAEAVVAITPDSALCGDCARELSDPHDRRHRYPFINCTNCGPRYSIIRGVPYDRPLTTMAGFVMCSACQAEYDDPSDRRYHAQPNACADCGPRATLVDGTGRELVGATDEDPAAALVEAGRRLRAGQIVAIKGLGGYHLACRADDDEVVRRLRERKGREAKPLALLVRDLELARSLVSLDDATCAALSSPAAPIALAPRRVDPASAEPNSAEPNSADPIAASVAPGYAELGLVLPYTPLHALLVSPTLDDTVDAALPPLVLTSGNASGEPLSWRDDEAIERLGPMVDALLVHDRPIERPIDDSVVRAVAIASEATEVSPAPTPLRRARGYVPDPLPLGLETPRPVLALGGDLKGALCVVRGGQAVLGEHLGDLEHPAAYRNFVAASERLCALLRVEPEVIVCDQHPGYHSSAHARALVRAQGDTATELHQVQHHHAHAAACMVDNGLPLTGDDAAVVALVCDGTGYGDDGSIWGGEVLVGDALSYRRAACLRPIPLLGGDAAARQCWRPAAGLMIESFVDEADRGDAAALSAALERLATIARGPIDRDARSLAAQRLASFYAGRSRAVPRCSSLGRLFDAVAALTGLARDNRYEGEAATRLEAAALRVAAGASEAIAPLGGDQLSNAIEDGDRGSETLQLDSAVLMRDLVARLEAGEASEALAWAFHEGVARLLAAGTARVAQKAGLDRVVLSGGCFANRLLLARVSELLETRQLTVYRHRVVPCGDGGLALGQAAIAAARLQTS